MDRSYEAEGQKMSNLKMADLVLMTKEEASRHEKEILRGEKTPEDIYEPDVLEKVRLRRADQKAFDQFR